MGLLLRGGKEKRGILPGFQKIWQATHNEKLTTFRNTRVVYLSLLTAMVLAKPGEYVTLIPKYRCHLRV